jgi:CDP-4-dehydro-6-deoxyglucose reductase
MALEAAESLSLVWIASARGGHYLDNLCRSWGDALDDFRYVPLTLGGAWSPVAAEGVLAAVLKNHPALEDCDVYVAGPESLANAAEVLLLDRGLPRAQLFVITLAP